MSQQETVQVPKRLHSALIGPGGANIRALREKCGRGFQLDIPDRSDSSEQVTITGTDAQRAIARQAIAELTRGASSGKSKAPTPTLIEKSIEIPQELHCAIIGEKGKNIQAIRKKSGVRAIQIPAQGVVSNTIVIQGESEAKIAAACKAIEKFAQQHQHKTEETDELYGKYRVKSQLHAENRNRLYEEATAAYNRGEKAKAAELSKQGKIEHHKMLKAQNFAALKIFKAKNKNSLQRAELDLHGLHAKEAAVIVDIYLHKFQKRKKPEMKIICGKGLHSEGDAVLKPRIIELLQGKSLRYQEDECGTFTVQLR